MSKVEAWVREAAYLVELDLLDRRGLRQKWQAIDDNIKDEIRGRWSRLIQQVYTDYNADPASYLARAERLGEVLRELVEAWGNGTCEEENYATMKQRWMDALIAARAVLAETEKEAEHE